MWWPGFLWVLVSSWVVAWFFVDFGDVYLFFLPVFFVGFEECFGVAWVLVRAGVRQIQRGWFGIWIRCKIKRHMRFV